MSGKSGYDISDSEADAALALSVALYDPKDKYPEWSNSAMREAYRAGWEDGNDAGVDAVCARLETEVERLRARETKLRARAESWREDSSLCAPGSQSADILAYLAGELLAVLDGEGGL